MDANDPIQTPEAGAGRPALVRGWRLWALLAAAALLALALFGRGGKKEAGANPAGGRPVPVVVAQARQGDMPVSLTGLGTVTALNTVTVRSRVDGQLMRVAFTEGQMVRQGDLLAEIDPRPFQVQLMQAEGQLAKDEAAYQNAQADLKRLQGLVRAGHHLPAAAGYAGLHRGAVRGHPQERPGAGRERQAEPDLQPHHRAHRRPRRPPARWMPATWCTPPIPAAWSSSPSPADHRRVHHARGQHPAGAGADGQGRASCPSRPGTATSRAGSRQDPSRPSTTRWTRHRHGPAQGPLPQ